jgi:hypothetical protein
MNELDTNENDQIKSQYKIHFKSMKFFKVGIKQDVDDGKYNQKDASN